MEFTYDSSLAAQELRLLQPVSVKDRVLRFETRRVRRGSVANTPYTAVSYTWGNQDPSDIIYLDNKRFYVRPNLWSCLYYISHAAKDSKWDYLWVDAICINQTSDVEKTSQVQLMDQTYRDAVSVSVWLGLIPVYDNLELIPDALVKTLESPDFDWIDSLVDLSNRPYWSRVWVIQEFLLGRNVELYCSDNRIDWIDFQELLSREAGISQFNHDDDDIAEISRLRGLTALPLVMGRHMDKHPEFLQPLCDLLIDHHNSQCHDPRDKVFGLLGLISIEEREFLGTYFPNYSMTEDQVLVITLAHLTQFPSSSRTRDRGENITVDSVDLFQGLGVQSRSQRRRLLNRAREIDYLSGMTRQEMLRVLVLDDQEGQMEREYAEDQGISNTEQPTTSCGAWLVVCISFVLFAVWFVTKRPVV